MMLTLRFWSVRSFLNGELPADINVAACYVYVVLEYQLTTST